MMKKMIFLVMVFLLKPELLIAQNLLSNGAFDADINGWTNPFVTAEWVSSDGAPISGAGSMRVTGVINNNTLYGMNSDVISVQGDYWYLIAGSFKTPAISISERGVILIEWFDSSDVLIVRDSIDSGFGVDDDVWLDLDGYLKAPDNAITAVIRLMLQSGTPEQMEHPFGLWDDAVVMQETVFIGDFD